jgi:hypothetical protein
MVNHHVVIGGSHEDYSTGEQVTVPRLRHAEAGAARQ